MTGISTTNHDCSSNGMNPSNNPRCTGVDETLSSNDPNRHASHLLQSRVGREKQRYDGNTRLLVCIVVSRRRFGTGVDEFLLISSSKDETQWIIPKGGWENDESAVESALREADEEAGVMGDIVGSLGSLDFLSQQGKPCRFYGFKLLVTDVYEHWAEKTRKRKWVLFNEACELLKHRPELVEMMSQHVQEGGSFE
ncbi:unnamed protein product [Peronospora belbahrii]|uniref:Nudix hydrolase domain-containing protein n=1 Tax=Peronospora belbahrii TaxID=622444 RepID=A0AAU9KRB5_9STRA|nr:unnamed protein product [Peronospora belbahrii]